MNQYGNDSCWYVFCLHILCHIIKIKINCQTKILSSNVRKETEREECRERERERNVCRDSERGSAESANVCTYTERENAERENVCTETVRVRVCRERKKERRDWNPTPPASRTNSKIKSSNSLFRTVYWQPWKATFILCLPSGWPPEYPSDDPFSWQRSDPPGTARVGMSQQVAQEKKVIQSNLIWNRQQPLTRAWWDSWSQGRTIECTAYI